MTAQSADDDHDDGHVDDNVNFDDDDAYVDFVVDIDDDDDDDDTYDKNIWRQL